MFGMRLFPFAALPLLCLQGKITLEQASVLVSFALTLFKLASKVGVMLSMVVTVMAISCALTETFKEVLGINVHVNYI